MELKDTVELMLSGDYKERFLAEYYQLAIRASKLHNMIVKADNGELNFKPDCPIDFLKGQLKIMENLLMVLEARAVIEKVKIPNEKLYINQLGVGFVKEMK